MTQREATSQPRRAERTPRYFTDPYDVRVMTYGVKLARHIASRPAMAGWAGQELCPGPGAGSDEEIADYIRRTHNTAYHPAGTVRTLVSQRGHSVRARADRYNT